MNFLELEPQLQKEVISVFNKRFPSSVSRSRLLTKARVPWPKETDNSWDNIFFCLADNPILLKRVLHTALVLFPKDQNLEHIVYLFAPNPVIHRKMGQNIAILAGALLAMIVFWQIDQPSISEKQQHTTAQKTMTQIQKESPHKQIVSPTVKPVATKNAQTTKTQQSPVAKEERDEPATNTKTVQKEQSAPKANKQQADSRNACPIIGDGELLGYWYAGDNPPDEKNGWVVLEEGRNVRLDYPDIHNGYNSRSPINCVLFKDTKVPVQKPAIHVPGDKYWVPLYSQVSG